MSDKPEALLLADALLGCAGPLLPILPAAACLLRQHAEIESLKAERDALLKALCELLADAEFLGWDTAEARAAIAKAGGNDE